jgi:tRNA threonylcarbamoyl adenosine modification protein YeaZ
MKILALEFSSPQRRIALVHQPESPGAVSECEIVETGNDSNKPFEMIESVLHQARIEREQIDRLAIGLGPGSYTGIRAAIALAQGWQLGRAIDLVGLSSAECLVAGAHAEGVTGRIAVVIDAQRGEFYLANYQLTSLGWRELQPLRLASQADVTQCEEGGDLLLGPEVLNWFPKGRAMFPRAVVLGKLGLNQSNFMSGEQLEPIYLRQTNFVKAPPPRVLPE